MPQQIAECPLSGEGPDRTPNAKPRSRTARVNVAESPIGWLYARGHLDDRLFAAGEQLRADFERAQLAPNITMNWNPVRTGGSGASDLTPTERQIAAKARFDGAIAQAGGGLSDILWRVVCHCEGIPHAERALEWPARSGKLVLKLALDRVADYYRIN